MLGPRPSGGPAAERQSVRRPDTQWSEVDVAPDVRPRALNASLEKQSSPSMKCSRCERWSPEYREICPFCRHAFPRSLDLERSRRRLAAERLLRKREFLRAAEREKVLAFWQRRQQMILHKRLGAECVYSESGIILHCVLVSVACQASSVTIGLDNLGTPGFMKYRHRELVVKTGWPIFARSTRQITSYLWSIDFEPERVKLLKRIASENRERQYSERRALMQRAKHLHNSQQLFRPRD